MTDNEGVFKQHGDGLAEVKLLTKMVGRSARIEAADVNWRALTVDSKTGTYLLLLLMLSARATLFGSDGVDSSQSPASTSKKNPPLHSVLSDKSDSNRANWTPPIWPVPLIADGKLTALGLRKLAGRHLVLYTDLPSSPDVDELPKLFDEAVPQWCEYFGVNQSTVAAWRMVGYLINNKTRFEAAGALRPDVPKFLNGFQLQNELWFYEQPSAYYRRHLLLHEGTHGFMNWRLGGCGPPWYMEGNAELLATHEWTDGKLRLRYFPGSREKVPEWGRIKIVKDDVQAGRRKTLEEILQYDETAHLRVEPYGWCWAAANFFDSHPRWKQSFQGMQMHVHDRSMGFSQRFLSELKTEWPAVRREWQVFVSQIDYGYDVGRSAIDLKPTQPIGSSPITIRVNADRGWQSSGIRLQASETYLITAEGRFQLGQVPKTWWCEPTGVTIRFYRGWPLGMLTGAIVDEVDSSVGSEALNSPEAIGVKRLITPEYSGTLYLRLNDSPVELADNIGFIEVTVTPK